MRGEKGKLQVSLVMAKQQGNGTVLVRVKEKVSSFSSAQTQSFFERLLLIK